GKAEETGKDLELQLCNIFYVFARTKGAVLIGKRPEFSHAIDPEEPQKVVLGWVPESRVSPWEHRQALYWAAAEPGKPARTHPGCIFRTPDDAIRAMRGGVAIQPIFTEDPIDGTEQRPQYGRPILPDTMRYPLLEWPVGVDPSPMINGSELRPVSARGA